jgi:DNA-binding transcriptional LysR family regulator
MFIDHVNLNHIRVFECVYRTRSMTLAAQELHLTQSGVSQHIKSLEDMLGVQLFDRIQQKLVATSAGALLFKRSSQGLREIEEALWTIKGADQQLSGTVTIGMPTEFGTNLVLPLLAQIAKKHPLIHFKLNLGLASAMNSMLLGGEVDFAFVDDFRLDRRIKTERVYDETLELCISEELIKKVGTPKNTRRYFESLEYVEYQEDEPVLRKWFAHHLHTKHIDLNVRTTVMDVQALARLIVADVGAGILPGHRVAKLEQQGRKIYRFKGCGKPLKNTISIAYLAERTHAPPTLTTIDALKTGLLR